jgi:hypothetical protein
MLQMWGHYILSYNIDDDIVILVEHVKLYFAGLLQEVMPSIMKKPCYYCYVNL